MNNINKIRELIDKYFEGISSDIDEQQLREYFLSDDVDDEFKIYSSIFTYLSHERKNQSNTAIQPIPIRQNRRLKIQIAVAGIAACIVLAFILFRGQQTTPTDRCTGTYVMIDGICYDELHLVSKYVTETIDKVTKPIDGNVAASVLDFLDEK